jgi:hypothetical protein
MIPLGDRVEKLSSFLGNLSEPLRLAYANLNQPYLSLTSSRLVMERLVHGLYVQEMDHEPKKPLLGDMLNDNQFTRLIERRVLARMNTVREMGNFGPHGIPALPADAERVLSDLCEVLEWHLEQTTKANAPGSSRQAKSEPIELSEIYYRAAQMAQGKKVYTTFQAGPAGCRFTFAVTLAVLAGVFLMAIPTLHAYWLVRKVDEDYRGRIEEIELEVKHLRREHREIFGHGLDAPREELQVVRLRWELRKLQAEVQMLQERVREWHAEALALQERVRESENLTRNLLTGGYPRFEATVTSVFASSTIGVSGSTMGQGPFLGVSTLLAQEEIRRRQDARAHSQK